jgi:Fic family protein
MRVYDYSFLEHGMLPAGIVNLVTAISELRAHEQDRKHSYEEVFEKLESVAKVQSVKGSNAIEGIVTSDRRINEIVNQNSAPLNHDEAEIAGYRDALDLIHSDYQQLDFRERDILRLHEIMLSYAPVGGGQYKEADNVIMHIDAEGMRRIRFTPVSAEQTADAMEQLTLAYLDARNNYNINQLMLIPCVILDFLCIHPFTDGNGRMSRLLSLLLLYKNGFDAGQYVSFEEQISRTKAAYYGTLQESSAGWHTSENTYFPFITHFMATLLYCYKELDKRFAMVNSQKVSKRERIEVTVLGSLLPISRREISEVLTDVSPTTVEKVLHDMLKDGRIEKIGAGRATRYVKKE